jgi:hypothetical protein
MSGARRRSAGMPSRKNTAPGPARTRGSSARIASGAGASVRRSSEASDGRPAQMPPHLGDEDRKRQERRDQERSACRVRSRPGASAVGRGLRPGVSAAAHRVTRALHVRARASSPALGVPMISALPVARFTRARTRRASPEAPPRPAPRRTRNAGRRWRTAGDPWCHALRHRVAGRVHGRTDGAGVETRTHHHLRAACREVHLPSRRRAGARKRSGPARRSRRN